MKPAPIQLTDYFVTDLHLSANPKFDPKNEIPVQFKDFQVGLEASSTPEKNRDWQLSLKLQFQPPADANVPYRFSADIVGFFFVHPDVPKDRIEPLVKTNGSSMLFGALREIIRETTARGPFPALILPATSFYETPEKKPDAAGKLH
jgi:preprotein translocase subunit SecB